MSFDLTVFANADFDPNDYTNAILAAEPYPTPVVISKLSVAIEDTSKHIKNLVATHHQSLLSQASNVNHLSGSLTSVKFGLNDLESSLDKLRLKIRAPYQSLQENLLRLQKLHQASDVLRRASRFVVLARRLQIQMNEIENSQPSDTPQPQTKDIPDPEDDKERTIAKAALSIAELTLLAGPKILNQVQVTLSQEATDEAASNISLRSIDAIAAHMPFIEEARAKVTAEMESMVLAGLNTLNQSLLASSLQTAYNLRVLAELVRNLILDLSQAVEERIRCAFDISKISKDALAKESTSPALPQSPPIYRSRVRTEPTNITAPQFTAALWSRLEVMAEEMADCCIKVYTLEKVLKLKRDAVTGVVFLEEAMKSLDNKPSATFWTSLGRSLEKHARDSAKSSTFLQQTLCNGYPKLLRLFQEFFAKIALHTDTVYSQSHQSPEAVFILRSLSNFESSYLSRSSNKLNEAVAQAFSGGIRAPPGFNEGISIARAVANELDSARFDPLLVKSVSKNAALSLDMFLSRMGGMVVKDRSATALIGPTATPQQISNAQLASCLYQCWHRLEKLKAEQSEAFFSALHLSVQNILQAYENLVGPIKASIRREFGAIIAKLHRVDFGKTADSMSGMGGPSFYMKELVEKLAFVKAEVLSKFSIGEAGRTWLMDIVSFVIRTFVLHVSIARPLTESGKLQLTSDMTELEFGLSAFMVDNPQSKRGGNLESIGDDYRALRAMRPLLFLDSALLADPERTAGLPPLIVLHHIIVRSPVLLPHELHGWQEAEYVRWVDEHIEREAWTLIEGGLAHWEVSEPESKDNQAARDYLKLARIVLKVGDIHVQVPKPSP